MWKPELQRVRRRLQSGVRLQMASWNHDLAGVLNPDLGGPPQFGIMLAFAGG